MILISVVEEKTKYGYHDDVLVNCCNWRKIAFEKTCNVNYLEVTLLIIHCHYGTILCHFQDNTSEMISFTHSRDTIGPICCWQLYTASSSLQAATQHLFN